MQDEESLVRRAQQGDTAAMTLIYEANFDRIYRYIALKIGDRTEAEDLSQQVFLNACQSIKNFTFKGMPFTSWLYRIAHNQVVDHLRKKTRRPADPLPEMEPAGNDDPVKTIELKLEMETLAKAAEKLTHSQREVISLRFAAQMSIAEVAKTMGKTEGAVKALQHSAVAALRRLMAAGTV